MLQDPHLVPGLAEVAGALALLQPAGAATTATAASDKAVAKAGARPRIDQTKKPLADTPSPEPPPPAPEKRGDDERAWTAALDKLRLEKINLHIEDRGPQKPVALDVQDGDIDIDRVSLDLARPLPIKARLALKQGGQLDASGQLSPQPTKGELQLRLVGLQLKTLSPYLSQVATLNLDEATSHPDFAYKPETGEELFHSFAGVPIIRKEDAVGVLCVQHVESRRYEELEIEALQTVAMVLSELIANAGLIDKAGRRGSKVQDTSAQRMAGLKLVDGMASGYAVFHQPRVTIEHTVAEDIEAERHRVYAAFDKMREQIERMASEAEFGVEGEHREVLEMYKMFAYDEGWRRRINEAIDSGLTAEAEHLIVLRKLSRL